MSTWLHRAAAARDNIFGLFYIENIRDYKRATLQCNEFSQSTQYRQKIKGYRTKLSSQRVVIDRKISTVARTVDETRKL